MLGRQVSSTTVHRCRRPCSDKIPVEAESAADHPGAERTGADGCLELGGT